MEQDIQNIQIMNNMWWNIEIFQYIWMAMNIFSIIAILLTWYGIYTLAKKMNIKNAWIWWIPLLQLYTLVKIAWLNFFKDLLLPFIVYIVSFFLWWLLAFFGSIAWIIWMLWIFLSFVYFLFKYIRVLSSISKRTWRWGWTTLWLFFVSFIMFPIVATKFKWLSENNEENKEEKEEKEEKVFEL